MIVARALHGESTDHQASSGEQTTQSFCVEEDDLLSGGSKLRLDSFLSNRFESDGGTSRARLQSTIKQGRVTVNGKLLTKASYAVKVGDVISCSVLPPPPLRAEPENIPLDIVYEDDDVIVINKSADMVMHPSPGHCTGTMVNALLHHCGIVEGVSVPSGGGIESVGTSSLPQDDDDGDDDDDDISLSRLLGTFGDTGDGSFPPTATIRPGIVHRLDKGTTGLVVVAKTDVAHASLSRQFKDRTVDRTYLSITLGTPKPSQGRITTNIGRDFRDRKKMAAFEYECTRGKTAASNYQVLESLGASNCACVAWKLDTGRTHQIRVHAKYIRHPLLGDEAYGGTTAAASRIIGQGKSNRLTIVHNVLQTLHHRPALHAETLDFDHPTIQGKRMMFSRPPPEDFISVMEQLKLMS